MKCWMQTHNGIAVDLLNPKPEHILLEDIGHALARLARFNGHLRQTYTVAEHCIHVASLLPPQLKIYGLLHDATEAYMGDLITPIKDMCPEFRRIESVLEDAIYAAFNLPPLGPGDKYQLKKADRTMLFAEKRTLMQFPDWHKYDGEDAQPFQYIKFWPKGIRVQAIKNRYIQAVKDAQREMETASAMA